MDFWHKKVTFDIVRLKHYYSHKTIFIMIDIFNAKRSVSSLLKTRLSKLIEKKSRLATSENFTELPTSHFLRVDVIEDNSFSIEVREGVFDVRDVLCEREERIYYEICVWFDGRPFPFDDFLERFCTNA